jgi:hypothetical protein
VHDIADPDPRPWTDAHRGQEPVYVDHTSAATFCAWIGGYLPSLAQTLRSAQGDALKPSVGAMNDGTIACDGQPPTSSQLCGQIADMNLNVATNGLYPVGQVAADVGPFGDKDLFGEGFEGTRTFADFRDPRFCALVDGAPDYVTFETDQFSAVQFATLEQTALLGLDRGSPVEVIAPGNTDPSTDNYATTFRCAFDWAPGIGQPHDG